MNNYFPVVNRFQKSEITPKENEKKKKKAFRIDIFSINLRKIIKTGISISPFPELSHVELYKQSLLLNFQEYLKLKNKLYDFRKGDLFERYHFFSFNEVYKHSGRKDLIISYQDGHVNGPVDMSITNKISNKKELYQMKCSDDSKSRLIKMFQEEKYSNQNFVSNHDIPEKKIRNFVEYEDEKGKLRSIPITTEEIKSFDSELQKIKNENEAKSQLFKENVFIRMKKVGFLLRDSAASQIGENLAHIDKFKSSNEFIVVTGKQTLMGFGMKSVIAVCDSVIDEFSEAIPGIGIILIIINLVSKLLTANNEKMRIKYLLKTFVRIFLICGIINLLPIPGFNVLLASFFSGLAERGITYKLG